MFWISPSLKKNIFKGISIQSHAAVLILMRNQISSGGLKKNKNKKAIIIDNVCKKETCFFWNLIKLIKVKPCVK